MPNVLLRLGLPSFLHPDVIRYDSQQQPIAWLMQQITDHLLIPKNCYLRADQLVIADLDTLLAILTPQELAGRLNSLVEFFFVEKDSGQYKPLPVHLGNTWLHHPTQRAAIPVISSYSRNPVFALDWRLVAPGYDAPSRIFYAGPAVFGLSDGRTVRFLRDSDRMGKVYRVCFVEPVLNLGTPAEPLRNLENPLGSAP